MNIKDMYAVILAGGFGTRLSEETHRIPKPMVEVGGHPMLVHIMNVFWAYGVRKFIVLGGYKQYVIKEFFANFFVHENDIRVSLATGKIEILSNGKKDWEVTVLDTGLRTMTGGRLLRAKPYLEQEEAFFFTYGDGLSDVDLNKLLEFHQSRKDSVVTLTGVPMPSRFGNLTLDDNGLATEFSEKSMDAGGVINGGFMVVTPNIFDYLSDDTTVFEQDPLRNLCNEGRLYCYRHTGFWRAMDTLRDKMEMEKVIVDGVPEWLLGKLNG